MANLIEWNSPFEEFQRLQEEFGRYLSGRSLPLAAGFRPLPAFSGWGPAVDVSETQNEMIIRAEIPGVDPNDLDLTVTEDGITLRGEVKQETLADEHGYRRIERRYGSFHRTIPFPVPVKHEQATAQYRNGILDVRAPKAEHAKCRATKLRIDTGQSEPKQLH